MFACHHPSGRQVFDGEAASDVVCVPASTRYISTVSGPRQAIRPPYSCILVWWLGFAACLLAAGCTSAPEPTVGDDEFVGRPAETTAEPAEAPSPLHGTLWYRLEPGDEVITIHLRLMEPPSETTFFLPGPWAERDDFDERIRLDHAHGPGDDTPLPLTVDRDQGRIDVATGDREWVELIYHVETDPRGSGENRFTPWHDDDAFFAYAPTILILPSAAIAHRLRDIPVELHVPANWTVASTWTQKRDGVDGNRRIAAYLADDIRTLRDAYVGAGDDWRQLESTPTGRPMRLTLTGEFDFDDNEVRNASTELLREYLRQFGLYDEVSAIVHPVDDSPDNFHGAGRHGGFVLEIPPDSSLDDALLILIAHEALHMWNGHQLVPKPDIEDETQWFKEGLTHYVALKTLARLDLVDTAAIRDELARAAHYYVHNPLVAGGQIRTIDRTRFPYDRGLLIGLVLDAALLQATGGRIEIEDWFRLLLDASVAESNHRYDPEMLRDTFRRLTADFGDEPMRQYDRFVRAGRPLDVHRIFDELGLHFLAAEPDEKARVLPIDDESEPFEQIFAPDPRTD